MIESFLRYIQYEKRFSDHTILSYKNDLRQLQDFLRKEFSIDQLSEVNYSILRSWVIDLSEKKLKPKSINRKIISIRSFYKFLHKTGGINSNPASKVNLLKVPKNLPHFVNSNELLSLLDHLEWKDNFSDQRDRLILELFYGTGIRENELINLKEKDVDFIEQQIKVLGKRNKERIIPINRNLSALIKKYLMLKKESPGGNDSFYLIVTNKGNKAYPMFIYRIVKKYLTTYTNVEKTNPHVLRHTFATHLLNNGADLNSVKDLLGHQSLASTQVYTHNTLDKLKKIFEQAHPKA